MTQCIIRRVAIAAVLVAVLALAAPAQAASMPRGIPGTGWFEMIWQSVAGLWPEYLSGKPAGGSQPAGLKTEKAMGVSPDGAAATQPPNSSADKGLGIDPDG